MRNEWVCNERECKHYRQFYITKECKNGCYVPDLELAAKGLFDKRCAHPKVFTSTPDLGGDIGVSLVSLKGCPIIN